MDELVTDKLGFLKVEVSGPATIAQAEQVWRLLCSSLREEAKGILLDLESVVEADSSFFQLLLAFRRSLETRNRMLSIKHLAPGHVVREKAECIGLAIDSISLPGGEVR